MVNICSVQEYPHLNLACSSLWQLPMTPCFLCSMSVNLEKKKCSHIQHPILETVFGERRRIDELSHFMHSSLGRFGRSSVCVFVCLLYQFLQRGVLVYVIGQHHAQIAGPGGPGFSVGVFFHLVTGSAYKYVRGSSLPTDTQLS